MSQAFQFSKFLTSGRFSGVKYFIAIVWDFKMCRKLPPCGNFQHSVITVKIPFISQYSKIYTCPYVVMRKANLEVKNVF